MRRIALALLALLWVFPAQAQMITGGRAVITPTTTVNGNLAGWGNTTGSSLTDSGYAVGTAGAAIPLMNGANTWSGVQTFSVSPVITGSANTLTPAGAAATNPVGLTAGGTDSAVGVYLIPKGNGAFTAAIPDSTATGGNARGNNAVDWQVARSSANQVASGNNSVVGGGSSNIASASSSTVPGGFSNLADGNFSMAGGTRASARTRQSINCWSAGLFSATGDAQTCVTVMRVNTPNGSAARMTVDAAAAGSTNCVNIPNSTAYSIQVEVIGRNSSGPAFSAVTGASLLMSRGANAASTAVTVSSAGTTFGTAGTTVAYTADTTNGCLNASVTPPNANGWDWAARVVTTEVQ